MWACPADEMGTYEVGEYKADGEKQKTEQGGGGKQMSHHEGDLGFAKIPELILSVPRNHRRLLS